MSWFPPPQEIPSRVFARLPDRFRRPRVTVWSRANKGEVEVDCFLEGPAFDHEGRLYVVDIPNGRVFRLTGEADWELVVEYDGWPNGLRIDPAGRILIADYRNGLMQLDPETGAIECLLPGVRSEGFKGLNDLAIARSGEIFFTDQGQTGMQDPSGRVWRLAPDGRLDCLIATCPSPNGVVLNAAETYLYVALTRACQIWRAPLTRDSGTSKVQVFAQLPGGVSGPDGLAMDEADGLAVCDPGHGCVWLLDAFGVPRHRISSCAGRTLTNLAYGGPDNRQIFMTESATGQILVADAPVPGRDLAA